MMRNDSKRVSWRNKAVGSVYHVAVTVTIGSSAKLDVVLVYCFHQRSGIDKVGIWVMTPKIRFWDTILSGILEPKFFFEDVNTIRPCDTVESIKQDLKV